VTRSANRSPQASLRSSRPRSTQAERLLGLLETRAVVRARELAEIGVDRKTLARLVAQDKVEKRSRGLYALAGSEKVRDARLAEACKRVPGGVICLFSALYFHELTSDEPPAIWMAIDRKARAPSAASLRLKIVRFSGRTLAEGVTNLNRGGVPLRVYSAMKTIADSFKYRGKIGLEVGVGALAAAIEQHRYNRQKLLRFADICRVPKIVAVEADKAEVRARKAMQASASLVVTWDRQALAQDVWAEPLKHLARRYGISDVALAKRCRKLGIALPGRGYWAKKLRLGP
jgi:predicted transcriptional regulator of viral defense system